MNMVPEMHGMLRHFWTKIAGMVTGIVATQQALFAGGELSQTEKDLFFEALMTAYVTSKQQAKEKYGKKKS